MGTKPAFFKCKMWYLSIRRGWSISGVAKARTGHWLKFPLISEFWALSQKWSNKNDWKHQILEKPNIDKQMFRSPRVTLVSKSSNLETSAARVNFSSSRFAMEIAYQRAATFDCPQRSLCFHCIQIPNMDRISSSRILELELSDSLILNKF